MTSSGGTGGVVVTLQKAWARLTTNMGGTNLERVRQARKAANALNAYLGRH